ncbi:hypothetical protein D3C75_1274050 [compost metagenome]
MKNILLLGLVKLSFVSIRDIYEPIVLYSNNYCGLVRIAAFTDLHKLTELRIRRIVHA